MEDRWSHWEAGEVAKPGSGPGRRVNSDGVLPGRRRKALPMFYEGMRIKKGLEVKSSSLQPFSMSMMEKVGFYSSSGQSTLVTIS